MREKKPAPPADWRRVDDVLRTLEARERMAPEGLRLVADVLRALDARERKAPADWRRVADALCALAARGRRAPEGLRLVADVLRALDAQERRGPDDLRLAAALCVRPEPDSGAPRLRGIVASIVASAETERARKRGGRPPNRHGAVIALLYLSAQRAELPRGGLKAVALRLGEIFRLEYRVVTRYAQRYRDAAAAVLAYPSNRAAAEVLAGHARQGFRNWPPRQS